MKPLSFLLLLILGSFLLSCEKNSDKDTGNVIFLTNAQAMLDCGPFDVEIYIDGTLEGVIEEPVTLVNENTDCSLGNQDCCLLIQKPDGAYDFTAKLTWSDNVEYLGSFTEKKDSCSVVFIDLSDAN
jgi:hypothetical protein